MMMLWPAGHSIWPCGNSVAICPTVILRASRCRPAMRRGAIPFVYLSAVQPKRVGGRAYRRFFMRVRHRIPSIFNLSMVDVLCCALGCVILLWLINLREAKHHEESAEEEHRRITSELAGIRVDRDKAIALRKQLEVQIESLQKDKNNLLNSLNAKQAEAADLAQQLKLSGQRIASLESELRERSKRYEAEAARTEALEKELRLSEKRSEKETARSRELTAELKETRRHYAAEKALASALEKEIAQRLRDLKDANKNLEKLVASRHSLQRDLEARDREMTMLRQQNKILQGEAARVRAAAEKRFAGITLTGRRVLFLVDMSASMDLVDENTKAPAKWADVGST